MTFKHLVKYLSLALTLVFSTGVMAQGNWPSQPIKIINPFPTGERWIKSLGCYNLTCNKR